MASSLAVANYFLEQAEREGRALTPLQVIKLTYIAHGWHLAIFGRPLVDEPVRAWRYGPVMDDLYHALKRFGRNPVSGRAKVMDWLTEREPKLEASPDVESLLKQVWDVYGHFSGSQLIHLTHQPGTPWDQTCKNAGEGAVINEDAIRTHFHAKANRKKSAAEKAKLGA